MKLLPNAPTMALPPDKPTPTSMSTSTRPEVKAAKDFEAMLIRELYASMRATVHSEDSGDTGKQIFDSMLDEQLAQNTAETGGFGLADAILKQLDETRLTAAANTQVFGQAVDTPSTRGGRT